MIQKEERLGGEVERDDIFIPYIVATHTHTRVHHHPNRELHTMIHEVNHRHQARLPNSASSKIRKYLRLWSPTAGQ